MSSKTVKKLQSTKQLRPRDGGSYKRNADGSLTRIPDPKPEAAPAPDATPALSPAELPGALRPDAAPALPRKP